jgi:hypothetical protein
MDSSKVRNIINWLLTLIPLWTLFVYTPSLNSFISSTSVKMALFAACSQTTKRLFAHFSNRLAAQLPSRISALPIANVIPSSRPITTPIVISTLSTSKRLIHTCVVRKATNRIAGPTFSLISKRGLSFTSPLQTNQTSSGMSFSSLHPHPSFMTI